MQQQNGRRERGFFARRNVREGFFYSSIALLILGIMAKHYNLEPSERVVNAYLAVCTFFFLLSGAYPPREAQREAREDWNNLMRNAGR